MIVEEKSGYPKNVSYFHMKNFLRTNECLVLKRLNNQIIAIIVPKGKQKYAKSTNTIQFSEKKKVPLWKQSIELSMGKMPKEYNSNIVSRYVMNIEEEEYDNAFIYKVYAFVSY